MAALLSPPLMQVSFSPFGKVICEPVRLHGDAAQFAAVSQCDFMVSVQLLLRRLALRRSSL